MRFFTVTESADWCRDLVRLDEHSQPLRPNAEKHWAKGDVPVASSHLSWFCRYLEQSLTPRQTCMLWVTGWGIWPSNENLHLYYRLRQSYGDHRLLHEAPGHLFLDHEGPDLVSFLQLGVLFGWDMHLIPTVGYARAFVSHDEFVEFASDDANEDLVKEFVSKLSSTR